MRGQVIGKSMPHGYAGSYARQADMVVDTHPSEGEIAFGAPVVLGTAGAVKPWEAASTAAKFVGVALREVKSATDYMNQNEGGYHKNEAVPFMKRGCVNVICQNGTPAPGGRSISAPWKMSLTRRQLSEASKRQQIPERTWN